VRAVTAEVQLLNPSALTRYRRSGGAAIGNVPQHKGDNPRYVVTNLAGDLQALCVLPARLREFR
jgi:hypothetical protein